MNDQYPAGEIVLGRLVSATLNAGDADIPLFTEDAVARVLAVGERLIISNVVIDNEATAKTVTIYQDVNSGGTLSSGETLLKLTFAAAGPAELHDLDLPSRKLTAATQTIRANASAAGAVSIYFVGKIIRS
jgi:hypothetical protein